MRVWFDRGLALLLLLGAAGHTVGSLSVYRGHPETLLWSLNTSGLIALIAWLNLWRTTRAGDRALAWTCVAATAVYCVSVLAFGHVIHNFLDPRVIGFGLVCAGLTGFSYLETIQK